MTYYDMSLLKGDTDFLNRTAASIAAETLGGPGVVDPDVWATQHAWAMAAQPGFGDAYGYAILNGNENPGRDPAVITDAQILSAVQLIVSDEANRPVTP